MICLHGIGGSVATFAHQLTGLSERFRVVARDAPGYGRSSDPTGYPGEGGYLDDIAGIIKDEGRDSAYILGMSWGGVLAMRFALVFRTGRPLDSRRHDPRIRANRMPGGGHSRPASGVVVPGAGGVRAQACGKTIEQRRND